MTQNDRAVFPFVTTLKYPASQLSFLHRIDAKNTHPLPFNLQIKLNACNKKRNGILATGNFFTGQISRYGNHDWDIQMFGVGLLSNWNVPTKTALDPTYLSFNYPQSVSKYSSKWVIVCILAISNLILWKILFQQMQ